MREGATVYRDARMRVPGVGSVLLTSEHYADGTVRLYAHVGIPLTDRSYLLWQEYGCGYREAVRRFREGYARHAARFAEEVGA